MKYVLATKEQITETEQRVLRHLNRSPSNWKAKVPCKDTIVEFLLNERGFTMERDKATYPKNNG